MNIKSIKLGMKLEINLVNTLGEKVGYTYVSQLEDIIDESQIVIASPIHASRVIYMPAGAMLNLFFIHEKQGLLSFFATIQNREQRGNLSVLVLSIESPIEKIQRRKFYRLDNVVDAFYRPWYYDESDEDIYQLQSDLSLFKKCLTRNISGSGLCIIVYDPIIVGMDLQLIVPLNEQLTINEKCVVVRSIKSDEIRKPSYELGLHFTSLNKKKHDAIIKYVFQQQRLHLEKKQ